MIKPAFNEHAVFFPAIISKKAKDPGSGSDLGYEDLCIGICYLLVIFGIVYEGSVASIFIVQYFPDHTGFYRIEMDVSAGLKKVDLILDEFRFESSFKKMAVIAVLLVVVLGVGVEQVLHYLADGCIAGLNDHVEVVGH